MDDFQKQFKNLPPADESKLSAPQREREIGGREGRSEWSRDSPAHFGEGTNLVGDLWGGRRVLEGKGLKW